MSLRRTVVRSMAVVFLLMTAAEVFGCELLSSPSCELSSPAGDSGQSGHRSGDECFCCCHHIVLGQSPIVLTALEPVELLVPAFPDSAFEFFTPSIDQPPRA